MTAPFKRLCDMHPSHKQILLAMHSGKKATYDLFDFPGTSPSAFDVMASRYGVIVGNHRHGFAVTRLGAEWASRQQVA